DVRHQSDLESIGENFDFLIEASAEPSVHAGISGGHEYLIDTNLGGTVNCLNYARKHVGAFIFLSTSRVYSIADLRKIPLVETESRFAPDEKSLKNKPAIGLAPTGISEAFETRTVRSLYGASKLCSEYLIEEFCSVSKLPYIINRCGVIAGPGQ